MRTMDVTITLSRMSSPGTCLAGFYLHTATHGKNHHECTFEPSIRVPVHVEANAS